MDLGSPAAVKHCQKNFKNPCSTARNMGYGELSLCEVPPRCSRRQIPRICSDDRVLGFRNTTLFNGLTEVLPDALTTLATAPARSAFPSSSSFLSISSPNYVEVVLVSSSLATRTQLESALPSINRTSTRQKTTYLAGGGQPQAGISN